MWKRPLQDAAEISNDQGSFHAHGHSAVSIGLAATLFCQVRPAIMIPLWEAEADPGSNFALRCGRLTVTALG